MRWMNRLARLLIGLAIVAGPPVAATLWLLHHPARIPTQAQVQAWIEQPMTAGTVIAGCVLIAVLVWLLLATYLVHRAVTELRRRIRHMRHLSVPTPAQMTASSMAGVAAFALPALPAGHPQPLPATTSTPQPADTTGPAFPAERPAQARSAGIALPGGGWIPYRTAAAITALAAATWLQRRRHYQPHPHHPSNHRNDIDLQPLPATVDGILTAIADEAGNSDPSTAPALHPQQLPRGVLLLTGPGAAAAARGLLVTEALSTTGSSRGKVSMRLDDLDRLLPASTPANTVATEPTSEPGTVIALGDDPTITHRWHVTADGTATGTELPEPRRLCTLDARTATDLLTLINPTPSTSGMTNTPATPDSGRSKASAPIDASSHLTLLGGCHLTVAGEPVHIPRTAGLQVMAYLATQTHGATRNELTNAIWPHLPAGAISQRFHTTLADLRRQLRPLLGDDPVIRHDDHYLLNTQAIACDLEPWRTAVHAMDHAVGTAAQEDARRLVVDTYRGEIAAGHTWPWLTTIREQARRTVLDACTGLAEHADPAQALRWLQHAITIDPYNEPVHQRAADLLYAAGDHAGATDLIKRLRNRLTASPDTHRLSKEMTPRTSPPR